VTANSAARRRREGADTVPLRSRSAKRSTPTRANGLRLVPTVRAGDKSHADRGFEPLTDEDFGRLENLGRRSLSAEVRSQLKARLEEHCGPRGDLFLPDRAKHAKTSRRQRDEQLSAFACDVEKVLKGLEWASPHLFHSNALIVAKIGHYVPPQKQATMDALKDLRERALQAAETWRPLRRKRGPEPNHWLAHFVFLVALSFHAAGGRISTAYHNSTRGRAGPFLRFLSAIHDHLPANRRAPTDRALFDHAHRLGIARREQFRR
jgi:hypothetical protein